MSPCAELPSLHSVISVKRYSNGKNRTERCVKNMISRQMVYTYYHRICNCDNLDSICQWTIGYCHLGVHKSVNIHHSMVLDNLPSIVKGMPIDFEHERTLGINKFQLMTFESGLGTKKCQPRWNWQLKSSSEHSLSNNTNFFPSQAQTFGPIFEHVGRPQNRPSTRW